jgi:RNA polymerase sigma-70 factor (ECF subfamily)
MKDVDVEPVARLACHNAVAALIARHGWSLLSEEELVERTLALAPAEATRSALEQAIKQQYNLALYESCRQTSDLDRRKRAYADLFRYLYRAAYNRWPDIAEEVVQRAIVLVNDKLDNCRHPEAMLTFAALQARRAATEIIRLGKKEVSLDEIADSGIDFAQPPAELPRFDQNCLRSLSDALSRLPEQQRRVIALKYLEGLSDDAISERTSLSVNNIRVLRNRGMTRLRADPQLLERCG